MPTLSITGMRCGHCQGAVTKALSEIPGVSDVSVDLEKGEAAYTASEDVDVAILKEAIAKIGFEVV